MPAGRAMGRVGLAVVLLGILLPRGAVGGSDRPAPSSRRVDAELLLNLDLLSDEPFTDDRRDKEVARSARSSDEFDLPGWDGDDERREVPRK